ncbi:putative ribonuclease H-like domain-containing protein [Tanacetum coccineum]
MDVEQLFRLVKERYNTSAPEGFDLMLWGDLHTLFEPDKDDEIWRDQHEYNLLSWRLCDFCGIHILLMDNGLAIHMLTEKKYPLSQEMLSKMLSRKLEVDHESSQAFELLRFIRAQICDKKNRVLFTDTDFLVLSKDFMLLDEMAKASVDESVKWHRRMGHVNYKNMNRLVKAVKNCLLCIEWEWGTSPIIRTPYALLNGTFLTDEATLLDTLQVIELQGVQMCLIKGYKRDKANQSARTQEASTNPAGTHDADSDSECDEQVIIELARLKGQEERAHMMQKSAEELFLEESKYKNSLPTGSIPVPSGNITISPGDVSVPTGGVPVPTGSPTDLFFDDEPTTRFLSPPDLGNNEPLHEVSPVASSESITIHPQFDYWDHTSVCHEKQVEPRSVAQALEDPSWVDAMQEEMQQFKFQNVWVLVDFPEGHRQEEGIDYDEFFAPVARIKAIRLFLAFTSYMGFMVYQMDVKSAFLYRRITEEVYGTQPKGFVDPQHPKKVYKLVKALYGLHQALRAWYATLSTFLLKHGYRRGTIDKTLFLKKHKRDIVLGEFEMSAMGELTFFLGLQVQQRPDGIFISQDKYVQEILKKFDLECVRTATTPYEAPKPKSKNEPDSPVNVHLYRSMIGSLMYLIASRPDIMFAVSACSRNQVTPTTSNLEAVKKIFKYLKGQPRLGLWYPRESPFVLEAYSDKVDLMAMQKQHIVATSSNEAWSMMLRLMLWQAFDDWFTYLVVNIGMLNP